MASLGGRRVLKEGYLNKRNRHNPAIISSWRRRYFRLYEHELAYFRTSDSAEARARMELTLDVHVSPTNDQGYNATCLMLNVPNEPTFYLVADSEEDKKQWVDAIFHAARQAEAPSLPPPLTVDASGAPKPPPAPPTPRQERVLLSLSVVEARNLIQADLNGLSDPYCVISLIGKNGEVVPSIEKKTNYMRNTLNPVWKERFTVGHDVDLRAVDAVQLDLMDYNMVARHVPLGSVRVPLGLFRMSPASTTESDVVDHWFRVEAPVAAAAHSPLRDGGKAKKREQMDHGELHLVMSVSGPNLVEFFQSAHQAMSGHNRVASAGRDHSDNRLEVTVLAADGLTTAVETDAPNPFCELSLVDEHGKTLREETVTTDRKENTREPRWKGEHTVFGRVCSIEQAARLRVRVLDFFRKECMGVATVDLAVLAAYDSTEWYPLQLEPGMAAREGLGKLQLRIVMVGETRGERVRRQQMDRDQSTKVHDQSVEQLELENAQHLLHDAACKLDGARIACAANDYRASHPRFYGINGCIQQLNEHISRAYRDKRASDEDFQTRAGSEGKATLEVAVVSSADSSGASLTAVIAVDPPVCVEATKRTTGPHSPMKRKTTESSGAEARNGVFSKRGQAEVSTYRTKLTRNEMRFERKLKTDADGLTLVVEVLSGHELHGVDRSGYSDPYCTLTVTERTSGKAVEGEKKRTAVVSKTMNPKWKHEVFTFGESFPLENAGTLLIHVKDRNSFTRSTPLGRVQIPLLELYRTSINTATGESKAVEKRYSLTPEPWMDARVANLGDLCLKTEVKGTSTALSELAQRLSKGSPDKLQGALSISSFFADADGHNDSEASVMSIDTGMNSGAADGADGVVSEEIEHGREIRTMTVADSSGRSKWKNDKFSLSLSYPGMFSDANTADDGRYTLHLRVHGARNLLGEMEGQVASSGFDFIKQRDKDADAGDLAPWTPQGSQLRSSLVNAYFTIIPVLSDGRLLSSEYKQSLTVYDTKNPSWPEQEFAFGQEKDLSRISHLSLHVYSRDLQEEDLKSVVQLLGAKEGESLVWLKRCFLHKLSPSGEVDDDGFETLLFDQRVLAYRQCLDSGRFYPARVQQYAPLPRDEYQVVFESDIETISDIRDLFSVDVRAKIATVRKDGKVDVAVLDQLDDHAKQLMYQKRVSARQITPVSAFSESVERTMARRIDRQTAEKEHWRRMAHKLSGVTVDVLSTSNLPKSVQRPGCIVTLVANPVAVAAGASKLCGMDANGELTILKASTLPTSKVGERLRFVVPFDSNKEVNNSTKWFQQRSVQLGDASVDTDSADETQAASEASKRALEEQMAVLAGTASALIRIVDQEDSPEPLSTHRTVGYVKVDLATLKTGEQELMLRLVPVATVAYSKFVGSVFVRVSCQGTQAARDEKQLELALSSADGSDAASAPIDSEKAADCGLSYWYQSQLAVGAAAKTSRIGHRLVLRRALTPTQNAQLDAFHAVLVVVMKRVVSIQREVRLFEEFEHLPKEEAIGFRHVHTVSADENSEWLGRMINELSLEVRKGIVVKLEMELLEIANADWKRTEVPLDATREQWIKLRTGRQKALQEFGGFMMQDRTTAVVFGLSDCFTGHGMVSWITRAPSVLWKDGWTKYVPGGKAPPSSLLHWDKPALADNPDALQAPSSRAYALQWMSALCAAGYVEHVSSIVDVVRDFGRKQTLMEDRSDRYYRVREVDMWARATPRAKSLSPLDLVQELDCVRNDAAETHEAPLAPATASTPASKDEPLLLKSDFSKKVTPHCEGVLGMPSSMSSLFLGGDAHAVLYPVAEKAQEVTSLGVLCDWKYCLFVPGTKCMYVYEHAMATRPALIVVMTSRACRAAYSVRYDKKGGWFDVLNAALYVRKAGGDEYEPMSAELQEKALKPRANGDVALEFKASDAQRWVHSLGQAGVRVDLLPGQLVVLKQLDYAILQHKCIQFETEFEPTDLEASFQRLLNAFFGHHKDLSSGEQDARNRDTRNRIRNELKKAAAVGDTVMAYYAMGKRQNAKPSNPGDFTKGALHSGRVVRIRSPYSDPTYRVTALYDLANPRETPEKVTKLLEKYGVADKAAWLRLPDALRDLFLLYDVAYDHRYEAIVEEGLTRDQIRSEGGDLDAARVRDRCTDLNLLFRATDLEDCITRMATHFNGKKPLGCLKVPIKTVSPYRVSDSWFSLAPENDMVKKDNLGHMRIQLRLSETNNVLRSKAFPILVEEVAGATAKPVGSRASPARSIKSRMPTKGRNQRAASESTDMLPVLMREPSFLKISIHEAHNLLIADTFSSDPYVQLLLLESDSDREVDTLMKTDYKSRTLNPKWENQEFTLGKTDLTALSDKKVVLLRVRDHDIGTKDDPLGCLKLEFQRDRSGFVTELILHCAAADGMPVTKQLRFDTSSRVEMEAMLLPDERAGQSKTAHAKGNKPGVGKLGTLQFAVELTKNENYVDPFAVAGAAVGRAREGRTSAEIAFKSIAFGRIAPADGKQKPPKTDAPEPLDWSKFSVTFQPFGDADQRIAHDPNAEDLSRAKCTVLSDALARVGPHLKDGERTASAAGLAASPLLVLGRSYDVTEVGYFDVQLVSELLGKAFRGKFGHSEAILKHPDQCVCFQDEVIKLEDPNNKDWALHLTVDLHLIGVDRGARIKRVLADTFRIVGLTFDPKTVGRKSAELASFLWDVCKCEVPRGCSATEVLMAQVRRMRGASKLHWRHTPQLLWHVLEHVMCHGEKDRVSFANAVALDEVLRRWSRVLAGVEEAKSQLVGHLHGKLTPALIRSLFSDCDWTGVEHSSLVPGAASDVLAEGTRVHVRCAPVKHCSAAVDVRLESGQFVGATIIREYDDDHFDVAFCSGAKVRDEEDVYFSDDEDLPPLCEKEAVFLCPIAAGNSAEELAEHRGRVGTVAKLDKAMHPAAPVLVTFVDAQGPSKQWKARGCLDSTWVRVKGSDVLLQLKKDDVVNVEEERALDGEKDEAAATNEAATRLAKVLKCIGNGKYDVEFLDDKSPPRASRVPRARMTPMAQAPLYAGVISRVYQASGSSDDSSPPVMEYDVTLADGELVSGLRRDKIRPHKEPFPTDLALLGAAFLGELAVMDGEEIKDATLDGESSVRRMADKLAELWGNDHVVKVYVALPGAVESVSIRDSVTNQSVQARLLEQSASQPRFVGQYHGYIKGPNLYSAEMAALKTLYTAKAEERKQQQGEQEATETEEFSVQNCICLLLAPAPRVKVRGCLRLSLKQHSPVLFKRVLGAFLSDRDAFIAKLRRLLRAECGTSLPLNRKERVLTVVAADVCFNRRRVRNAQLSATAAACSGEIDGVFQGASKPSVPLEQVSINVRFELSLLPNDRGSMASAMADVHDDATRIIERLKTLRVLEQPKTSKGVTPLLDGTTDISHWSFETAAPASELGNPDVSQQRLEVEFTDSEGERNTDPSVGMELAPLEDARLSVRDAAGKTHELCLSIEKILTESQLRHHLVPVHKVDVLGGPIAVAQTLPHRTPFSQLFPSDTRAAGTKANEQMEPLSSMYKVKFEKTEKTARVPRADIRTDALRVDVAEVSQMSLSKHMGTNEVQAEVLLISSDFDRHANAALSQKTSFGLSLSPQGAIMTDLQGNSYPKRSTQLLTKAVSSTKWTKKDPSHVTFRYSAVDLQRVTAVRIELKERATGAVIGTTEIPMDTIGQDDAKSLRVVSVVRKEAGRDAGRVVGKMSVHLTRVQSLSDVGHVYAKRLVSENDLWTIDPSALLSVTLKLREDKVVRGLLAANTKPAAGSSASEMLHDPIAKEVQMRRLVDVMMMLHDMGASVGPHEPSKRRNSASLSPIAERTGGPSSPLAATASQLKRTLSHTKEVLENTAVGLGIASSSRRLPWAPDSSGDAKRRKRGAEVVTVESDLDTSTMRLRRTILKLHQLYCRRLVPKLDKLYALDAQRERLDVSAGEQLLRFFQDEVDDLAAEDLAVLDRVHQRLHLAQISGLLADVMRTRLLVKVLNGSSAAEPLLGVAHVPIVDLLDQHEHDQEYELLKAPGRNLSPSSRQPGSAAAGALSTAASYASGAARYAASTAAYTTVASAGSNPRVGQAKVRLRVKLSFSESSLLEQAAQVYKRLKEHYITQHKDATRRINLAVVPAQRRRWLLLQGYLEQLVAQSKGKMHWEQTPVLLNRVWDVFVASKPGAGGSDDARSSEYEDRLAARVEQYRAAVLEVHTRWANVQPKLDELLAIQAAAQIDAHRTPLLLAEIDRTVEGLDIVLSTALQQVRGKWETLRAALEQLVAMQERNKLHLALAPQLLKLVEQQCSRGLSERYAEAVAAVQFRWKAITGRDGPLSELRLTEDKGLHWRRTHELLLLLHEQCEGFSGRDARSLEVVQGRWDQAQEWLEQAAEMLERHVVDCTNTPFLLGKMGLDGARPAGAGVKARAGGSSVSSSAASSVSVDRPSPRKLAKTGSSFANASLGKLAKLGSSLGIISEGGPDRSLPVDQSARPQAADEAIEDPARLEGLAEWYAIEEARLELERIPLYRIATDADKQKWLQFSKDGKDTRLVIAEEAMIFSPANVRAALEDRGVIHKTPEFATGCPAAGGSLSDAAASSSGGGGRSTELTKEVLEEIDELERALDSRYSESADASTPPADVLANPERVAELYSVIEDLGKTELLWKVKHAVNSSTELAVPTNYWKLLRELELRELKGHEDVRNLVGSLALMLQKEELAKAGVKVAPMASSAAVKELTRQNSVGLVRLPDDMESIQTLLQERGLDRKGDPVFLRGMRIGTQARGASIAGSDASASSRGVSAINTGLGVIDTQVELLRKSMLMEALRKRNSLARTFPVASRVLGRGVEDAAEAAEEMAEVDTSGDYLTLVERFQQLLIHEAYIKRLASYAALDRCMRGLVRFSRDQTVTKEDMALALAELKRPAYRLPVEAFTREELLEAAAVGKIRTPTEAVLARCPRGRNAAAMAYYAAMSYTAAVFQELTSFRERVDLTTKRCVDSFPLEALAAARAADGSGKGLIVPRGSSSLTLRQSVMNWLLGPEESSLTLLQRRLSEHERQRLEWAAAAATLQSRWLQRGRGWCDAAGAGVGVKVLLQRLLLFETANKMHMVATDALLRELDDKCDNLRPREKAAREALALRYASNLELLERLVVDAEKCSRDRKLHTEETPALLHAVDQACVVPHGLGERHAEAFHVVTLHWLPHRKRLEELVQMHKEGTFSIHRTPELLSAMDFHTEGLAGSEARDNQPQDPTKQDEIRRGQRKAPSSRSLPTGAGPGDCADEDDGPWATQTPASRVVQPLSPREKQTSWKVVTATTTVPGASSPVKQTAVQLELKAAAAGGSPRRKSSLGDELKELLRSPSKWLMGAPEAAPRIQPGKYFPYALSLEDGAKPSE